MEEEKSLPFVTSFTPLTSLDQPSKIQQPIFHEIVDVFAECTRGNFKPYLICLKEGYISKEFIDPAGYNLIHYSASYNDVPLMYYLLTELKIDIDICSKAHQSSLMIAANFGLVEIIRMLLEYKADLTLRDNCSFTPLMYAAKQNHIPALIYFIYKGADVCISDANGCTVAHWASFKNNLFLLRLFRRLGITLTQSDSQGFTPFQRAFSNDAYESIKYLIEEKELNVLPEKLNVEEIKSESIKMMIQEALDVRKEKFSVRRSFWSFWETNPKRNAFGSYVMMILLAFWGFLNGVFYKQENDFYILNILFMVLCFYFFLYVYIFIYKLVFSLKTVEKNEAFEENDSFTKRVKQFHSKDCLEMALMDFSNLYKAIQPGNKELHNQNYTSVSIIYEDHNESILTPQYNFTFLHYIAYLIDRFRFTEALDIDTNRLCPTCLSFKLPKTKHCRYCGVCVSYYNHHSHIFSRCIDHKTHPYYFILLTLQQILLTLYFFLQIVIYSSYRTSYMGLAYFETLYYLLKFDGTFIFFIYVLIAFALFYNTLFWNIEFYGILTNQTYNEIFNRHRYAYLYSNWNDAKGRTWKIFSNATSQGIVKNVVRYVKRCLA